MLDAFISDVDADPEALPQPLRARQEAGRHLAAMVLRADEDTASAEELAEIEEHLGSATLWEKLLLGLPDGLVWELTEGNLDRWREAGRAGQIWIRWDEVPRDQDALVLSMANALRDSYRGRPRGGRPRGSRLDLKERAALESLGAPMSEVGPVRGWHHMVDSGAWKHDDRSDTEPKAVRARSERWRRLQRRAVQESGHD